jgi:acyl-CoA thioesterase FadM
VIAGITIDFRAELRQDDGEVFVRCGLASIGTSSVRTTEEIVKLDRTVAATAECVLVGRTVVDGVSRSRPLTDQERAALEALGRG